jgi:DMSO/TMAO reductase YedYZ heme-binding membrane subunit
MSSRLNITTFAPPSRWPLFWILAAAISVVMLAGIWVTDPNDPDRAFDLIRLSVRVALAPFLVAFTSSALHQLRPSPPTRWMLVNRKYFGLAFTVAMAWQFVFILRAELSEPLFHWYNSYGIATYAAFTLMAVTSFDAVRRRVPRQAWRRLHKTGVYLIWLYYTVLAYGPESFLNPRPLHFVLFFTLLSAYALRLAAWSKSRQLVRSTTASVA